MVWVDCITNFLPPPPLEEDLTAVCVKVSKILMLRVDLRCWMWSIVCRYRGSSTGQGHTPKVLRRPGFIHLSPRNGRWALSRSWPGIISWSTWKRKYQCPNYNFQKDSILCTSWYALIMELSFKGNIRQDRSAVSNFWHYPHFKGHVISRKYFTPVPFWIEIGTA